MLALTPRLLGQRPFAAGEWSPPDSTWHQTGHRSASKEILERSLV